MKYKNIYREKKRKKIKTWMISERKKKMSWRIWITDICNTQTKANNRLKIIKKSFNYWVIKVEVRMKKTNNVSKNSLKMNITRLTEIIILISWAKWEV